MRQPSRMTSRCRRDFSWNRDRVHGLKGQATKRTSSLSSANQYGRSLLVGSTRERHATAQVTELFAQFAPSSDPSIAAGAAAGQVPGTIAEAQTIPCLVLARPHDYGFKTPCAAEVDARMASLPTRSVPR